MRDYEGGAVDVPDHIGDRERLARAGHAEEGLVPVSGFDGFRQLGDGLRLVAHGFVLGRKLKGHSVTVTYSMADLSHIPAKADGW